MIKMNEIKSYRAAKGRCRRPNYKNYPNYGGRGIEFRFNSFDEFMEELGPKPTPRHQLDRIDNDGHYEPGNCRWVTPKQNSRNKRSTRMLTAFGSTRPVVEWAELLGVPRRRICERLDKGGWLPEDAVQP